MFYFVRIRLGSGCWNGTKRVLFVIALLVTKIFVPIAILVVSWKPLWDPEASSVHPYFVVTVLFEL